MTQNDQLADMVQGFSSPRVLLNRLRDMMARGEGGRERLQRVVQLIATGMVADVCSIYLRTQNDELELVATEGLRSEAISATRLSINEGLVGHIAETAVPLSIQDAPRHPNFSYRPETGEDPYHAFLGVPILRGGRVTGVLTVQNRTERIYDEDEVDMLQTIAMVIAEVVASGSVTLAGNGPDAGQRSLSGSVTLKGRVISTGLGIGEVYRHDPEVPAAKFFVSDVDAEMLRLTSGLETLRESVDVLLSGGRHLGDDPVDVLEAYRMLANDPGWASRLAEAVKQGLSAEAAVDRARREHRARLESARDPYLRARLHDLEDLDNRLLRILGGTDANDRAEDAKGTVLIARRLGPAELLEYRNAGLAALLLEEPAAASHAAIVARAIGVPTLGAVANITTLAESGDEIIVDAELGEVHVRPDEGLTSSYKARAELRNQREEIYRQLRDEKAVTLDGVEIDLMLNAGLRIDVDHLSDTGASGIGLFRTEFQFLLADQLPSIDEQAKLYAHVMDTAAGKEVCFRTLDVGADKLIPGLEAHSEENPALGWRSVRFALDHRGLFRRQMRALIRAAAGRPLKIMFPMVTTASEYTAARELLDREIAWATSRGRPVPLRLSVGAMLEAPALAYELDALVGKADFISVGTNDLMQFFHAADRMQPRISDRYDMIARPPLKFLEQISSTCEKLGLPVSVCGESAGRPLEALALLAVGYRTLSMPASSVGPIKRMIRSLSLESFSNAVKEALSSSNGSFRNELLGIASQHDVVLANA
ncbi:MAG: phosphoenolpyruvate--protein phosphotransferase [Pseudomonadota bacterium]